MIRVVLVDDQALLRSAFRVLVDSAQDMTVTGEASDGARALAVIREAGADVVLMDIRMPGMDGLAATREIGTDPAFEGVKVVILTTFESDDYVVEAVRAGASGFLGKGAEPDDLLAAIRLVAAGEALLSPAATRGLIERFVAEGRDRDASAFDASALDVLTARERQVLAEVAAGLSNDEIAGRLTVSPLTVKTHINRLLTKLAARDRAQLVVTAYETGLVRPRAG
ncbi:response regulator [Streptomyces marincola]|uniref:DNA-binding response regulator n=1 Tax=Streptomyces marincola TaxID=2878388 RepID=A0A1W7D651_9ACTN|nr:response regulator transcription factor [Streptomyces marincola]ARQ72571.1 DNA-binding response regulator [Streptomyces marincola]